ncbi:MAG TPA: magnesium transporter [Planctomycetota bacterium]|nr:magnesium transporter [Planctomycetota bacterium]
MQPALSPGRVRAALRRGEAPDVSPEVFVQLDPDEQAMVLDRLPSDRWAVLLRECDSRSVVGGLTKFGIERAMPFLRDFPPDDLAHLAIRLPPDYRERMLDALGPELAAEVQTILAYPEETAGGMMSTRYASVPEVVTVAKALEMFREFAKVEAISYVYVVDSSGKLQGTLPVRALLAAEPRQRVGEVASRTAVRLHASQSRDDVIRAFRDHHFLALPVVDDQERLVGVVTADKVLTAVKEQENQFIYAATGADAREPVLAPGLAARHRIPWITMTVVGGLVCALIGLLFKSTLERAVVLGLFVPLVLAVAESVAAQTATIVMRTLITSDIPRGTLLRFLGKEVAVGLLVGLYAAVLVVMASTLWGADWRLGVVIGGSVVLGVCTATLVGVTVPTLLRRLRVEPTVAGGPVVLMIADILTLFFYFGTATLVRP